jgi:hypothetical protein
LFARSLVSRCLTQTVHDIEAHNHLKKKENNKQQAHHVSNTFKPCAFSWPSSLSAPQRLGRRWPSGPGRAMKQRRNDAHLLRRQSDNTRERHTTATNSHAQQTNAQRGLPKIQFNKILQKKCETGTIK